MKYFFWQAEIALLAFVSQDVERMICEGAEGGCKYAADGFGGWRGCVHSCLLDVAQHGDGIIKIQRVFCFLDRYSGESGGFECRLPLVGMVVMEMCGQVSVEFFKIVRPEGGYGYQPIVGQCFGCPADEFCGGVEPLDCGCACNEVDAFWGY